MTTEDSATFNSCFFTVTIRPVTCAPFGITVFPSTSIGVLRLAANVSPTLFLSLASVWPTVALIAVPFGTVTIVAGSCPFATAAALGAVAGFVATAGFATAVGFVAAAGFAGAGFAVPAGFAVLVAWSVADCEQPAAVNTAPAAKASQSFRCTCDLNTSHLQRGTAGVNGMRWLVGPFTDRILP